MKDDSYIRASKVVKKNSKAIIAQRALMKSYKMKDFYSHKAQTFDPETGKPLDKKPMNEQQQAASSGYNLEEQHQIE